MKETIVHDAVPVTLVGGGRVKKSLLEAAIVHAPRIVAADGAARTVLEHGLSPEAVIGDFDSIPEPVRRALPAERCHVIEEQDSTDFEKCLARIDAPLIVGVGFSGGRLDHQLAVLHGLMRYPQRRCLLLGRRDVTFLAPPEIDLDLPEGSRVSLFPMAEVRARSRGLRWPLDGLDFAPGLKIGTSNQAGAAPGEAVRIATDRPAMLIILPVARLPVAVSALCCAATPGWDAR